MFIWGTDLAKRMALLTRILVSCLGLVSNKMFFPYLLLLSSHMWLCLFVPLTWSLYSLLVGCPSLFCCFSAVLFCPVCSCADLKHFLFKTYGEIEAQSVVSCDWFKAITWNSARPDLEPWSPVLASPTFPSTSHCLLFASLDLATSLLLGHDPASGQIQPNRNVLCWGSLHRGLEGTMGLLEMKLINSNA